MIAVAVLAAAGLFLLPALAVGDRVVLSAAAAAGYLAGLVAARILSDEHARTRREAARDRAAQAHDYRQIFAARVREQGLFIATMTARQDSLTEQLEATLRRVDDEKDRARAEADRSDALQTRVDELETRIAALGGDLTEQPATVSESVEFWYGRHDPSLEELLAFEERTA